MMLIARCHDPKCGDDHALAEFFGEFLVCESCRWDVSLNEILPEHMRKELDREFVLKGYPMVPDWVRSPLMFHVLAPENVVDFGKARLFLKNQKKDEPGGSLA